MPYSPEKRKLYERERSKRPEYKERARVKDKAKRRQLRLTKPFIFIDGEGISIESGEHIYDMIAASTGEYIYEEHGLTFQQIARFFMYLKLQHKDAIFVGFGLTYDVNMWLKSLGLDWIEANVLDDEQSSKYHKVMGLGDVYMSWRPHKSYTLSVKGQQGLIIYDVFGFFQTSFVKALIDNGIATAEELEPMEEMKSQRADFANISWEKRLAYCQSECIKGAQLMEHLRECINGLIDTPMQLDLIMSRWDGAGALGAAFLSFYKVKEHRWPLDRAMPNAVLQAYYGGRFEAIQLGEIKKGYSYDINSAYPEAMSQLPCLREAYFTEVRFPQSLSLPLSLCYVKWELPPSCILAPFPFRDRNGHISFPLSGRGWYWSYELNPAISKYAGYIEVQRCLILHTSHICKCSGTYGKPFDWIPELFEYRRSLKEVGDARQLPIKLGLNSGYGKLAQGVGSAPFQDFIWAGMITSYTRGKILKAIYDNNAEDSIIEIATDGLLSTKLLDLNTGSGLGAWEYGTATEIFIAGNGLMEYSEHGKRLQKVRGFGKGERIPWTQLRESFRLSGIGSVIRVPVSRFIGVHLARHLKDKQSFAFRWFRNERVMTLLLQGRELAVSMGNLEVKSPGRFPSGKKGKLIRTLPLHGTGEQSKPHKAADFKGKLETEEQALRLIEEELLSSD